MRFDDIGIENKVIELEKLDMVLHNLGFFRGEQGDFERATFDRKFENLDTGEVFYLRIPAFAVEGDIDSGHADVKLLTPLLGKHYYPHGVEYGEGENFPKNVLNKSKDLLQKAKAGIEEYAKA
jgi:hypothetical protein